MWRERNRESGAPLSSWWRSRNTQTLHTQIHTVELCVFFLGLRCFDLMHLHWRFPHSLTLNIQHKLWPHSHLRTLLHVGTKCLLMTQKCCMDSFFLPVGSVLHKQNNTFACTHTHTYMQTNKHVYLVEWMKAPLAWLLENDPRLQNKQNRTVWHHSCVSGGKRRCGMMMTGCLKCFSTL